MITGLWFQTHFSYYWGFKPLPENGILANGSRLLTEIVQILMKKMKKNNKKFCY